MQNLNDLFYFVQVVDHGGFAVAARATGVPKSKLSRRLAELEKRLGVELIHRSTRGLTVTELGQAYYDHCVAMLSEAETAQEIIDRSFAEPQGLIRMSCPPGLLCFVIAAQLTEFMRRYPHVRVELEATGRRVNLVKEGFDLALRVRFPPIEDGDIKVRALSHSPQRLMAAPSLFDGYAWPQGPEELTHLPSLDWIRPRHEYVWYLDGPNGSHRQVSHEPRLVTDDLVTLRRAALDGIGIVQLPLFIGAHDIAEGALVDVLPGWAPTDGVVQAVFPSSRGLLPAVRLLIEHLAAHFSEQDLETVL